MDHALCVRGFKGLRDLNRDRERVINTSSRGARPPRPSRLVSLVPWGPTAAPVDSALALGAGRRPRL